MALDRKYPVWQQAGMQHPFIEFRNAQMPPLSKAGLARLLGVSRQYIQRIEAGERRVGHEMLPLINERTGLAPEVIRPDLAKSMRAGQQ